MDGPYFSHDRYGVDVYLKDFDGLYASGISLRIGYSNTDIHIDEVETVNSAYPNLITIMGLYSFVFLSSEIRVIGFISPSHDGILFTNTADQYLFTIYFSGAADECTDFSFIAQYMTVDYGSTAESCAGGIGDGCEPTGFCLEGYELSGTIESSVLDCSGASNGGIPDNYVDISEINGLPDFGCATITETDGDYACDVVEELDYRITPINENDRNCGVSELDLIIYRDVILQEDCFDHLWQLLSGDVNGSGMVTTIDLVAINKAILGTYEVTWPSWSFVPVSQYAAMNPDLCELNVPFYTEYIDVNNVSANVANLDFVGIKMGDANGSCTECSDPFAGNEDILVRSEPIEILVEQSENGEYNLSFGEDISGLEIIMFSITCKEEPRIEKCYFHNNQTFLTKYKDGIFYLSYISMAKGGETYAKGDPFITLTGDLENTKTINSHIPNTIVTENSHAGVEIRKVQSKRITIYPNPVNNELSIDLGLVKSECDGKFYVYDQYGKLVFSETLKLNHTMVNLGLIPGLYFYHILASGKEEMGKLLVN